MVLLQQVISGLSIGSVYALVALGYTMVYGIVQLINFAHGDIIMVGSYAVFFAINQLGAPFWLAILASMLFCAAIGVLMEKVAYKPLRNPPSRRALAFAAGLIAFMLLLMFVISIAIALMAALCVCVAALFLTKRIGWSPKGGAPRISALITAIGVSLFLQNIFMLAFSPDPKPFPSVMEGTLKYGGRYSISYGALATMAISVGLMAALSIFISRTKMGRAMRAVSEDAGAAVLMGVNVNSTISATFAIGSALAAVGGALYSASYPQIDPFMGSQFGLKAFIAAVLGGIGVVPGAMLGGFAMGVAESLTKAVDSRWSDAVVFLILIIVLLFKPSGVLGKNTKEKV
ncbi:MAG: branched-chain amino acid ABC transporter permease [Clostridiales bacterium]|jgi:branched-chain amino acid transport system permease protein|nr:branched-chain amino acid ABC transporter permease [Clostridiales bacterium]